MFKVLAIYHHPSEEKKAEFEKYFKDIHTPLCLKVPGLKEIRVNNVFGSPSGASAYSMVVEMVFADKDSWKAAMKTPEMMETGKDAMKFAKDLVSVQFAQEMIIKA
jgi:uncharacterized protein (TIGR02118 family)